MRITKGLTIGIIFGVCLSFSISFIFMLVAQRLAGGIPSLFGESWLYYSTIVPFILAFAILGCYFTKKENVSNKKLWLISLLTALFITLYSGTFGAVTGEYIVRVLIRGGEYNWQMLIGDIFLWGSIYAFILLPLTTPLARLIIHVYIELLKKYKIAS